MRKARLDGWPGGVNQALPAKDIAPGELADALNFELTDTRGLRKRDGAALLLTGGGPFSSRVTSIFHFLQADDSETVIYTAGTGAWRAAPAAPGSASFTSISAAVTLPNDTEWMWATMDDVAYGVNGALAASGNTNPVQMTSVSGTLSGVTPSAGTIPPGTHVVYFARRLWIVDADNPSEVVCSRLGDATDWDTAAGDTAARATRFNIGHDEGGRITAVAVYLDQLIFFKERRIYRLQPGDPNTDATLFNIKSVATIVGALSQGSVQQVRNDLVFLSHEGLLSLQAVMEFGDFKQARLSENVPVLATGINKAASARRYASVVHAEKQQYILAVPLGTATENNRAWVMDYRGISAGRPVAWLPWDGGAVGASYAVVPYQGRPRVYVGGYDDAYVLDEDTRDDETTAAYDPGLPFFRTGALSSDRPFLLKDHYRVAIEIEAETDPVDFELSWRFDESDLRSKTIVSQFTGLISGSLYDDGDTYWDDPPTVGTGYYASEVSRDTDLVWSLRGTPGRRAQTVQFRFLGPDLTQGYVVKRLLYGFDYLEDQIRSVSDL